VNRNNSELTLKQDIKKKRGPKRGADIPGIYQERERLETLLLDMFLKGDMGVDPKAGLATLERFITERKIFVTKSGKPLSFNTIKDDFTEIWKEYLRKKPKNKKNK
jgi:hypothetical protein